MLEQDNLVACDPFFLDLIPSQKMCRTQCKPERSLCSRRLKELRSSPCSKLVKLFFNSRTPERGLIGKNVNFNEFLEGK